MWNHHAIASRCRPSFDSLEERSLLSGSYFGPGPAPDAGFRPPPPILGTPPPLAIPGSDGARGPQVGIAPTRGESWPERPENDAGHQGVAAAIVSAAASSTTSIVPIFTNPVITSNVAPVIKFVPEQNSVSPSNNGVVPGFATGTQVIVPSATPEPGTNAPPVSLAAPASGTAASAVGVAASPGREAVSEAVFASTSPIGATIGSQPAQPLPFIEDGLTVSTSLLSQSNLTAPGTQVVNIAPGQGSMTIASRPTIAVTSRGALFATALSLFDLKNDHNGEWPHPSRADLLASALPFDRASLDRAIDRFLHQFEDLTARELVGESPTHIVLYSLMTTTVVAGLYAVHRRWTRTGWQARVRYRMATPDPVGFPELPGSWSSRLS
jgi:hypothetical protein